VAEIGGFSGVFAQKRLHRRIAADNPDGVGRPTGRQGTLGSAIDFFGCRAKLRVMIADIYRLSDTDPSMFRLLLLMQPPPSTLPKRLNNPADALARS
jgi:hypothetical protein